MNIEAIKELPITQSYKPAVMERRQKGQYRERAGCVVIDQAQDGLKVLLIGSRSKNYWKIPAGGIEAGESKEMAAERETFEESGAKGKVGSSLHSWSDHERMTQTFYYLMSDPKLAEKSEYEEG
mmetsp:Transcript_27928/g.24590  ORF Transcript_27928/g.24590 Transcript_27928/m.24590 type:complete len:124 (+) Transcript_27928:130-501(+)